MRAIRLFLARAFAAGVFALYVYWAFTYKGGLLGEAERLLAEQAKPAKTIQVRSNQELNTVLPMPFYVGGDDPRKSALRVHSMEYDKTDAPLGTKTTLTNESKMNATFRVARIKFASGLIVVGTLDHRPSTIQLRSGGSYSFYSNNLTSVEIVSIEIKMLDADKGEWPSLGWADVYRPK